MRKTLKVVVCAGLAVSLQAASAALVVHDGNFGQYTLIEDTRTGLSWLRLDLTRGLSLEYVEAQTEDGGAFDGYRAASKGEVERLLFNNIAGPWIGDSDQVAWSQGGTVSDPIIVHNAILFTSLFGGQVRSADGRAFSSVFGWAACFYPQFGPPCPSSWNVGVIWAIGPDGISTNRPDGYGGWPGSQDPRMGTWLVATSVPEAQTYALMLTGLGALGLIARRRKESASAV